MENRLDSLTQKIYQEGIEKANQEGENIIENAKKEAEKIIKQAKDDAEQIRKSADKDAEEANRNTIASLKLASTQAISSLKQQIKELVTAKVLSEPTKQLFVDQVFLKELILSVSKSWDPKEAIVLSFSPSMEEKVNKAFESSIKKEIENLSITFDKRLANGFKITPQKGSFQITFTDQDFIEFFKPFVRDKAEKILFD
jgi:V/A-type H+/Na+-transporting ATPase subunit E